MFAAGPQPQPQPGFINQHRNRDQQHDSDGRGQIHAFEQEFLEKRLHALAKARAINRAGGFHGDSRPVGNQNGGIALALNRPGEHHRKGGSQHVQRRAADGLIRHQVNGGKGQKQRVQHARQRRGQNRRKHRQLGRVVNQPVDKRPPSGQALPRLQHFAGRLIGVVQLAQNQAADQRADNHHALQGNVDNTAALRAHAAQCHQQKRNGEQQRGGKNIRKKHHLASAPFPFSCNACFFAPTRVMISRISSEKALR